MAEIMPHQLQYWYFIILDQWNFLKFMSPVPEAYIRCPAISLKKKKKRCHKRCWTLAHLWWWQHTGHLSIYCSLQQHVTKDILQELSHDCLLFNAAVVFNCQNEWVFRCLKCSDGLKKWLINLACARTYPWFDWIPKSPQRRISPVWR